MPSVYFKTLGCKVNSFDSDALSHGFHEAGYDGKPTVGDADVVVVNTCSVTAKADREARYLARRIKRENPAAFVVFTGCYAQTDAAALLALDDIDLVIPNESKEELVSLVGDALSSRNRGEKPMRFPADRQPVAKNRQSHFKSATVLFGDTSSTRTRAFLKIQDGCDGFCSYCLIPYARGASRSVPADDVKQACRTLVEGGVREIVFTGIHIGDYGQTSSDEQGAPIAALLADILEEHPQLRIRISSLEPSEVTPELLAVLTEYRDQICDHFHLPLQSGDADILTRMRRTYSPEEYAETVRALRERFPHASIGADVIPGFPGETAVQHENTMDFIRQCELSYLHVFPYSKRPQTAAARMPDHIDGNVVKQRAADLRELSRELQHRFVKTYVGTEQQVLWLDDRDDVGRRRGLTTNYLDVVTGADREPGSLENARLLGLVAQGVLLGLPQNPSDSRQIELG